MSAASPMSFHVTRWSSSMKKIAHFADSMISATWCSPWFAVQARLLVEPVRLVHDQRVERVRLGLVNEP
jgi:hypothetical protein